MLVELDKVLEWFKRNLYDYQDVANDYLLERRDWERISSDLRAHFKEEG